MGNSFQKVWGIFSIIVTVLSLSSLSDSIVRWGEFITHLLESYQNLTYPVWNFLLGWMPINFSSWVNDYMTLGIILLSSFVQGSFKAYQLNNHDDFIEGLAFRAGMFAVFLVGFPLWPVILFRGLTIINSEEDRKTRVYTIQWIGVSLLVFLSLIIINTIVI